MIRPSLASAFCSILLILTRLSAVSALAENGNNSLEQNENGFPVESKEIFTQLLQQYQLLNLVHFNAKVLTIVDYDELKQIVKNPQGTNENRIIIKETGKHKDEGHYELWLADKRYRIESSLAKNGNVYKIAWDGSQLQYYDRDLASMTISTNLDDGFGAFPLDPLLAPFEMVKDIHSHPTES